MADLLERVILRQEESEAHIASLVDSLVDGFAGRTSTRTGEKADESVAELERRLAAMAADIDATTSGPAVEAIETDALSEQIAGLTREIAELRRTSLKAATGKGDVADLRADIAALSEQLGSAAATDHLVRIDRKLDLLTRQVQDPAVLASIQRETADIRARLGDLARQPDVSQRIERKLDALQASLEDGHSTVGASLSVLAARLEAVEAARNDNAGLSALEQQIAAMVRSMDVLSQAKPEFSGLDPALKAALAQSSLQSLPEELRRHYHELRAFQESEGRVLHKGLDALQPLLHQVSGRLAAVESLMRIRTAGAIEPEPQPCAVPTMFGRERPDDIVWSHELPNALAGDASFHLPGEDKDGEERPSRTSALERISATGTRGSFIAAARRAARAAAEAEGSLAREAVGPQEANEPFYKRHKRPILLGLAAVTMMMGALQGSKMPQSSAGNRQSARQISRPLPESAAAATRPDGDRAAEALFAEARGLDYAQASTLELARAAGLYRQAAVQGHASSQFLLGLAYDRGRGVGQDAVLAGLWYQRAAEHGSVKAMYNLAVLYAGGAVMGTPDYDQAARWFQQAAEGGHAASQYNFALLAAQGLGTPRDLAKANRFLAQAAAAGDAEARARQLEIEQRMKAEDPTRS